MAASEMLPLAKVGGLADVVGSLPMALKKLGVDIRVIIPKYGLVDKNKYKLKKMKANIEVPSGGQIKKVDLWQTTYQGIKVYFIDNRKYFDANYVYGGNNAERFLFFSLAVLHVLPVIRFKPDVLHCHDFFTALITDLLKVAQQYSGYLKGIKTLYTIHNLNHQGKAITELLSTGNLTKNSLASLSRDAQDGDINFMVQGIINADAVNTVSKTYAKEIATASYGAGIEKVIQTDRKKISGIVNGIDIDYFNPATDKHIYKKYSLKKLADKIANKLKLQKELGLNVDKNIPLVGLISRLVWQKGVELISEKMARELECQFVFLGTGQKEYENHLQKLARQNPQKVSAQIKFSIELAQKIYAASDIFLMPSRFEPCGLGQMIAMRYGTVPVVRATGGLDDTVDKKVGFKFKSFTKRAMRESLEQALNVYYKKPGQWKKLQRNCMRRDFSWDKSAREYLRLYRKLVK